MLVDELVIFCPQVLSRDQQFSIITFPLSNQGQSFTVTLIARRSDTGAFGDDDRTGGGRSELFRAEDTFTETCESLPEPVNPNPKPETLYRTP